MMIEYLRFIEKLYVNSNTKVMISVGKDLESITLERYKEIKSSHTIFLLLCQVLLYVISPIMPRKNINCFWNFAQLLFVNRDFCRVTENTI